jgi:hypothetical protein
MIAKRELLKETFFKWTELQIIRMAEHQKTAAKSGMQH